MTEIEKMDVVKSVVAKSGVDYDIDLYRDKKNKDILYHWGNMMGSGHFLVFSDKTSFKDACGTKKELYVIVDERYSFIQLTTFQKCDDVNNDIRTDEIVRFKKFNNNVYVERGKVTQNKKKDSDFIDLHSIEEMQKVNTDLKDLVIQRNAFTVASDFLFTNGFKEKDVMEESEDLKYNMMGRYIRFNTNSNVDM